MEIFHPILHFAKRNENGIEEMFFCGRGECYYVLVFILSLFLNFLFGFCNLVPVDVDRDYLQYSER